MYDYDDDITRPSIFHPISKKKAWLWKPDLYNEGQFVWEYKYIKPEYPKPDNLIYANLP